MPKSKTPPSVEKRMATIHALGHPNSPPPQTRWAQPGHGQGGASAVPVGSGTPTMLAPNTPGAATLNQDSGSALTVTWTAPAVDSTHGAATGFNLQSSPSGAGTWTVVSDVTSPYELSGLAAGAAFDVQLQAANAFGTSAWSATSTLTTATTGTYAPNAPAISSVAPPVDGTNSKLTITWTAPAVDGTHGAATGYNLRSSSIRRRHLDDRDRGYQPVPTHRACRCNGDRFRSPGDECRGLRGLVSHHDRNDLGLHRRVGKLASRDLTGSQYAGRTEYRGEYHRGRRAHDRGQCRVCVVGEQCHSANHRFDRNHHGRAKQWLGPVVRRSGHRRHVLPLGACAGCRGRHDWCTGLIGDHRVVAYHRARTCAGRRRQTRGASDGCRTPVQSLAMITMVPRPWRSRRSRYYQRTAATQVPAKRTRRRHRRRRSRAPLAQGAYAPAVTPAHCAAGNPRAVMRWRLRSGRRNGPRSCRPSAAIASP